MKITNIALLAIAGVIMFAGAAAAAGPGNGPSGAPDRDDLHGEYMGYQYRVYWLPEDLRSTVMPDGSFMTYPEAKRQAWRAWWKDEKGFGHYDAWGVTREDAESMIKRAIEQAH